MMWSSIVMVHAGWPLEKGTDDNVLGRYSRTPFRSFSFQSLTVRSFDNPAPDQKQARDWLPMRFPAVDVDAAKDPKDKAESAIAA